MGGGPLSSVLSNVGIQEVDRYPQPASQHVMAFTDHIIVQIKALCEVCETSGWGGHVFIIVMPPETIHSLLLLEPWMLSRPRKTR